MESDMENRKKRRMRMGFGPALPGEIDFRGLVNLFVIALFIGLFGFGIWWVIKSLGQAGEQYTGAVVQTKLNAESVECQNTLRVIGQNIQMYSLTNEGFPDSLDTLADWAGDSRMLHCPAGDKQPYVYIPGQRPDMRGENILVYEKQPIHDGKCGVLLLSGRVTLLTPQQLQIAVTQTQLQLGK